MAVTSLDIVRVGNITLGVLLILIAAFAARHLPVAGRGWLAAFLTLVGFNYALDPLGSFFHEDLRRFAFLATTLDPAALILFALAVGRTGTPRWVKVAVVLAPLFTAANVLYFWIYVPNETSQAALQAFVLVPYYVLSLALVARAHHEAATPVAQEMTARLLAPLAVIVVSRIPLVLVDTWIIPGPQRYEPWTIWFLDVPLVVLALATAALLHWTSPRTARASALVVVRRIFLLLAAVEVVWLTRFVAEFSDTGYALMYSVRWFVFAGVIAFDLRRYELLGVRSRVAALGRPVFLGILVVVVLLQFAALFHDQAGFPRALLLGAIATLPVAALAVVIGRAREPDTRARRLRIYRAHAELGSDRAALERLRGELGLTEGEAQEEERLIALEREVAPAFGRPEVGAVFARRYEIVGIVGSGAYGLVYAAYDRVDQRPVVLKELRPDWRATPDATERLRREAQIALRVSSPHLVRFLGLERTADGHVLVLEHVEGETLAQRLARAPLTQREIAKMGADLLDALGTLHAAGILHRDVKPTNVILRPNGDAVLIDLGAALPEGDSGTRPAGLAHTGTPRYMSPEARAGGRMTPASDLYSLGAVLQEALGSGAAAPEAWRAILAKAMHDDPAQRFPNAHAFRAALPAA